MVRQVTGTGHKEITSPPYPFTGVNLKKFNFRMIPICTGILPVKKLLK
jgi:hypothetical protein